MFKKLISLPFVLTLLGCTATPHVEIASCKETLLSYVNLRDNGSRADYQALFSQDATFSIPALSLHLVGAETIAERQQQAIQKFKTMHMMTTVDVLPIQNEEAHAESYFILYQQERDKVDAPKTVINGKYTDKLRVFEGKCLIQDRQVDIIRKENW
ncbi:nuclear transport factor 2 family protein (plasmid) [Pseudoalteromonas xiamenensis]|uniref:nuclear transport factor 2 family protein n=1 Tax=Pseudoalteromonas xiamenensis TaxID=882626 RepID=UPI0027E41870|nr:nuclear transport factor 2 family protein [Pseudoalteromonas xiamenensis]WMN61790.1 nuclear transport factor 2 family protein [Pseudoalteromonas xiamenensis]